MAYASLGHVGPFVTRRMARSLGMVRFFSGIPCKNGHLTERWSSNNICIQCYVSNRPPRVLTADEVAYRAAWRRNNAELSRKYRRLAYLRNKSKERASSDAWNANNREKVRVIDRNRKARMRNADGAHTAADVADILRLQKGKCAYCRTRLGGKYHVDHVLPISKGGSNGRENLQITCEGCNLRKSDIDPVTFATRLGRLL